MKKSFMVNPSLVQRLLVSEISSKEIANNTGVNLQVLRSFRTDDTHEEPLVPFEDMRLKLAQTLTTEAKRQKIKAHDTVFLTKDQIQKALKSSAYSLDEMAEKTGLPPIKLKVARKYAEDDKTIGIIRIGVVMRTLDVLDPELAV